MTPPDGPAGQQYVAATRFVGTERCRHGVQAVAYDRTSTLSQFSISACSPWSLIHQVRFLVSGGASLSEASRKEFLRNGYPQAFRLASAVTGVCFVSVAEELTGLFIRVPVELFQGVGVSSESRLNYPSWFAME